MVDTKKVLGLGFAVALTITGCLVFAYPANDTETVNGTISNGIDQGLTVGLPCSPASVSNGQVNATTCAITCDTNYTPNNNACAAIITPQQNGGPETDNCPNGDHSPSRYDGLCNAIVTTGTTNTGADNPTTTTGSITGSQFSDELNDAYRYAYRFGITTMGTIQSADMTGNLIRSHMAKMIVNYAVKVLKKTIDTGLVCEFNDLASETSEMRLFIKWSCQLGLMGYESDGVTQKAYFRPNEIVNRAQFGTVLSRLLRGTTYAGGEPFYSDHLDALRNNEIMNNITDPLVIELRGYVMLMLMRAAE